MSPSSSKAAEPVLAHYHVISGRVQGVGFRWSAVREAERMGIVGWIRNMPNGSVECWAQGEPANLVRFREWLALGPPGAMIASVKTEERKLRPGLLSFTIEH